MQFSKKIIFKKSKFISLIFLFVFSLFFNVFVFIADADADADAGAKEKVCADLKTTAAAKAANNDDFNLSDLYGNGDEMCGETALNIVGRSKVIEALNNDFAASRSSQITQINNGNINAAIKSNSGLFGAFKTSKTEAAMKLLIAGEKVAKICEEFIATNFPYKIKEITLSKICTAASKAAVITAVKGKKTELEAALKASKAALTQQAASVLAAAEAYGELSDGYAESLAAMEGVSTSGSSGSSDDGFGWGSMALMGAGGAGVGALITGLVVAGSKDKEINKLKDELEGGGDDDDTASVFPEAGACEADVNGYRQTKCQNYYIDKCNEEKTSSGCKKFSNAYCGSYVGSAASGSEEPYCEDLFVQRACSSPAAQRDDPICQTYIAANGAEGLCPENVVQSVCTEVASLQDNATEFTRWKDLCGASGSGAGTSSCNYFNEYYPDGGVTSPSDDSLTAGDTSPINSSPEIVLVNGYSATSALGNGGDVQALTYPADVGTAYGRQNTHIINQAYQDICRQGGMYGCVQ